MALRQHGQFGLLFLAQVFRVLAENPTRLLEFGPFLLFASPHLLGGLDQVGDLVAARGDVVQFFEKVEVVRKKFLLVRKDQQKFNEIWQDISPLQMQFQAGLFGEDSFYNKTLRKIGRAHV